MIYRIKVDLMFPYKSDSDDVWAALKNYLRQKNIRGIAEEKSYIDYHLCGHDDGKPCDTIEHFEKE